MERSENEGKWVNTIETKAGVKVRTYSPPGREIGSSCGEFTKHYYHEELETEEERQEFLEWERNHKVTLAKDTDLELIWYQNHFQTNYESINFWLQNGCNSCVISNEITESEIMNIIAKTTKPLVLNVLAKNQIMYSRRTLLTNFNKYNNLDNYNDMSLEESNTNNTFFARENESGTIIYNNTYFNYVPLMKHIDENKIKFYLVMNLDLEPKGIQEIFEGKEFGNDGFLNKKTVYRMSEYNDR